MAHALALGMALAVAACAADVSVDHDVSYDDRFGDSTSMDVYHPSGEGPFPAVLMVHGGGWSKFSKDAESKQSERLAQAGYLVANINYRLVPDGAFPADVQDCICALSYLRAHAADLDIDPDRIAADGYSAGGHLVSMLGVAIDEPEVQPDCASGPTEPPAAVVSGAGPQDLFDLGGGSVVSDYLGGGPDDVPENYHLASPIEHVRPGAPPFLLVAGDHDLFVPPEQAARMRDALEAVGTAARLLSLHGGGHILNPGPDPGTYETVTTSVDTPEGWMATIDFLDHTVGPPP